jgi:3-deoxy-manno-octulosonate cytidylyltransferase (CMP-KDO synthetase)
LGPPGGIPAAVVVIPARFASTRLPGKPLAEIAGHPMIEHVYRRAACARSVTQVLVATDDARIAEAVRGFGGHVVMTSPDHPSGTDRVAEVAAGLACEVIVNLQGDEPAMDPAMLDRLLAPFAGDPSTVMATLGAPLDREADAANPNVVKVVVDRASRALYFSRAPIPYLRGPAAPAGSVYRHVGIYAYRREFLLTLARLPQTPLERAESLEQLRALEHGYRITVVETPHVAVSVDTPEDLARVRRMAAEGHLTWMEPWTRNR